MNPVEVRGEPAGLRHRELTAVSGHPAGLQVMAADTARADHIMTAEAVAAADRIMTMKTGAAADLLIRKKIIIQRSIMPAEVRDRGVLIHRAGPHHRGPAGARGQRRDRRITEGPQGTADRGQGEADHIMAVEPVAAADRITIMKTVIAADLLIRKRITIQRSTIQAEVRDRVGHIHRAGPHHREPAGVRGQQRGPLIQADPQGIAGVQVPADRREETAGMKGPVIMQIRVRQAVPVLQGGNHLHQGLREARECIEARPGLPVHTGAADRTEERAGLKEIKK
jgi:hypothetical protein